MISIFPVLVSQSSPKLSSIQPTLTPKTSSECTLTSPFRIFPFYNVITPKPTTETDEILTRRISEELLASQENDEGQDLKTDFKFGYLLRGFPFNTNQALQLDRYLNGVNLAIYLKDTTNPNEEYRQSIAPLLNYY